MLLQTGGTVVREAILARGLSTTVKWCHGWQPKQWDHVNYSCHGLTMSEHRASTEFVTSNFGQTCSILATHWDASLLQAIPSKILQNTVTVTSLRHPVDRVYRQAVVGDLA